LVSAAMTAPAAINASRAASGDLKLRCMDQFLILIQISR
jgi:hypothetical protein